MKQFSSEWKEKMGDQLRILGFEDIPKLVDSAEEVDDRADPTVKAAIFMDYPVLPHYSGLIALGIRAEGDADWKIASMAGWVQMGSERHPEGFETVSKKYYVNDGPLPSFEELVRQVCFLIQVEEHKERRYFQSQLGKDFEQLGFPGYKEMDWDIRPWDRFSYARVTEPIGGGPDLMKFEFTISPSRGEEPIHISAVSGTFYVAGAKPEEDNAFCEKTFLLKDGPIPSKTEITRQVLADHKLDDQRYDLVRKRFQMGTPGPPGHRRQGHLGI